MLLCNKLSKYKRPLSIQHMMKILLLLLFIINKAYCQCPTGQYATSQTTSVCTLCNAGTFTNTTGQYICTPCRPYTYQPNAGATSCLSCTYAFNLNYGAATCISASSQNYPANSLMYSTVKFNISGTFNIIDSGKTININCPSGQYSDNVHSVAKIINVSNCQSYNKVFNVGGCSNVNQCCMYGSYMGYSTYSPINANDMDLTSFFYSIWENRQEFFEINLRSVQYIEAVMLFALLQNSNIYQWQLWGSVTNDYYNSNNFVFQSNTGNILLYDFTSMNNWNAAPLYVPIQRSLQYLYLVKKNGYTDVMLFHEIMLLPYQPCTECPVGTYSYQYNPSASCTPCPVGTFQNMTGQSFCFDCEIGSTNYAVGQAQCTSTSCPAGFYISPTGCIACAPGTYSSVSNAPNSDTCSLCAKGLYSTVSAATDSTQCQLCATGTYSTVSGGNSSVSCFYCAPGTYSTGSGLDSSSGCVTCGKGSYAINGQCAMCNPGTYSTVLGASTCMLCSAGTYTTKMGLWVGCDYCGAGTYSTAMGNPSSSQCTLCFAGTYSTASAATLSSTCDPCPIGYYHTSLGLKNPGSCIWCTAGTYSTGVGLSLASQCSPCSAGTYSTVSPAFSSTYCLQCGSGKYSTAIGAKSPNNCFNCIAGTFSTALEALNSSFCVACVSGKYSTVLGRNSSCADCTTGTYSTAVGATLPCPACTSGRYWTGTGAISSSNCSLCGAGTYSTGSSIDYACTTCSSGTYSTKLAATTSATCTSCATGTFSTALGASSVATCTSCGPGTYSVSGSPCANCSQGFYSNTSSATTCSPCSPGYYNDAEGASSCQPCPADSWCTAGTLNTCPQHTTSMPLSSSQHACLCLPGYFGDGSLSGTSPCALCWANYHCPGGNFNISYTCPEHSTAAPGSSSLNDCVCDTDYVRTADNTCICAPDHFCTNNATFECPANSTSPPGSTLVTDCVCNAGFYGSGECTPCPIGSFCPGNGSDMIPCTGNATTAGRRSIAPTDCFCDRGYQGVNNSACSPCPVNSWCWTGIANECPANTIAPLLAHYMTNCTCAAGFTGADGGPCYGCAPGFYCSGGNVSQTCPAFSNSVEFAQTIAECVCNSGFVRQNDTCVCAPGTRLVGDECVTCEADTWCVDNVQSACSTNRASPVGSDDPSDCICVTGHGGLLCTVCAAGFFKDTEGNTECIPCAPGTYQASLGATACEMCANGTVAPQPNTTICSTCPPDTFVESKSMECVMCPPNSHTASAGSIGADACVCEDFFFQNNSLCVPCQTCSVDATQTQMCLAGTTTDTTMCVCHDGFEGDGFQCSMCAPGFFSSGSGAPCALCDSTHYCIDGLAYECPSRSHSSAGALDATWCICDDGTVWRNNSCSDCSEGHRCVQGNEIKCTAGTYAEANECRLCPRGSFSATDGATQCTVCEIGLTYNDEPTTETTGSTSVFNCSCGMLTHHPDTGACVVFCPPGYYADSNFVCQLCPQGFFCNNNELTACPQQYSALPGASVCSPCPGFNTHTNLSLAACGLLTCETPLTFAELGPNISALGNVTVLSDNALLMTLDAAIPIAEVRISSFSNAHLLKFYLEMSGLVTVTYNEHIAPANGLYSMTQISELRLHAVAMTPSVVTVRDIEIATLNEQWQPISAVTALGSNGTLELNDIGIEIQLTNLYVGRVYRILFESNVSDPTIMYEDNGIWLPVFQREFVVSTPNTRVRIHGGILLTPPEIILAGPRCQLCGPNEFCAGNDMAQPCLVNSHADGDGATQCTCDPGFLGINCTILCPLNHYCLEGVQYPCPIGSKTNAIGSSSCEPCMQDEFCKNGYNNTCVANAHPLGWPTLTVFNCTCDPGFEGDECSACEMGYYCSGGMRFACPSGTYNNQQQRSYVQNCVLCDVGQWAHPASSVCTDCAPGSFSINMGLASQDSCDICDIGYVCTGRSQRVPCAPGSYSITTGLVNQSQCSQCPEGSFCIGGTSVTLCPLGSFSPIVGVSSALGCSKCPQGFYCPSPLTMTRCPDNTLSPPGAHDLGECVCEPGYQCQFRNVVHAEVVLPVSVTDFETIREEYIAAVAAAAGVSPSQVVIVSVTETVPGGGARRRLLTFGFAEIHVSIHTNEHRRVLKQQLASLDRHLALRGMSLISKRVMVHREVY